MNNRQRIVQEFVANGLKEEAVSRATRETFSFYEGNALLYRYLNRKGPIHSTGHMHPEVMVVSDHPEDGERVFGFSGYGQYSIYLMIFFQRMGLSITDVFWTHAIKEPAEKITMEAIRKWQKDLYNEIYVTKPTAIVALGTAALTSLTDERIRIDDAIGQSYAFELGSETIPIIPMKHPRAILGSEDVRLQTKEAWSGIKQIAELI